MALIQVTSREFRDRQASIFDLVDKGENVVINRGKRKSYTLTSVNEDDIYFTPKMLEKIDKSLQEAKEGKVKRFETVEELDKYLDTV